MSYKVEYTCSEAGDPAATPVKGRSFEINRLSVSHSAAEVNIVAGETVIILPPAAAKRLWMDLQAAVGDFESRRGEIKLTSHSRVKESVVNRVVKALYKSRKLSPKLLVINTRKRKHLPFDEGKNK